MGVLLHRIHLRQFCRVERSPVMHPRGRRRNRFARPRRDILAMLGRLLDDVSPHPFQTLNNN